MSVSSRVFVRACASGFLLCLSACSSRGLITTVGPDAPIPLKPDAPVWHAGGAVAKTQGAGINAQAPAAQQTPDDKHNVADVPFNDEVLHDLVRRAVSVSSSMAQATSRFAQARASLAAADSQALPSLSGIAEFTRTAFTFGGPVLYRSQVSAGAQASWEIDLFGGLARARQASQARLQAAALRVSAVKVSVAAETANAYVVLRLCEREAQSLSESHQSLRRSQAAVQAAVMAGVISKVELTRISLQKLDAQTASDQKAAQCERLLKALVALTDLPEHSLRERLKPGEAVVPVPRRFSIASVPAQVLENRADIAAAQSDVAAASADVGVAQADRYPALSLAGNLLPARVSINSGPALSVTTWALSPAVRLPVFDAGRRRATAQAAQVEYEAAVLDLRERIRVAVSEVEQSLVDIESFGQGVQQQQEALGNAAEALRLVSLRRQQGFSSGLDEETARRQLLASQAQHAQQLAQHAMAWIGLARAVGGYRPGDAPVANAAGVAPRAAGVDVANVKNGQAD